ncbi:MAG: Y-family DNA polymerase [Chitinophagaceae bacterium]
MAKRFVSIWFRHLLTDWFVIRQPQLHNTAFVLSAPSHGRMVITSVNAIAQSQGVYSGMVLADARAIFPSLQVLDDIPGLDNKLLNRLAEWCIRFTPFVAIDSPDGLILDITGCSHLWGGDEAYLAEINKRLKTRGYNIKTAMADTIGTAWAIARFGKESFIIQKDRNMEALLPLPAAALRLEPGTIELLHKLGLRQVKDFIGMPCSVLRRRFGQQLTRRINQALGQEEELVQPLQPAAPYQERLPCLELIVTITGIEIALQRLLENLCRRLQQEEKGLRIACFKAYRVDGKIEQVSISTTRPSHNVTHLFKLFENKLSTIQPDSGIELFVLEAPKTEDHSPLQEKIWETTFGLDNTALSELIDRLAGKFGADHIHRYLPDEHYWPERSVKLASSLQEKSITPWIIDRPRPLQLLPKPEPIQVTAPIPDYPPMLFRYKDKLHKIIKADGPERIEQEWWLQEGQHRDYYYVEDEEGKRYWLFRSGHYNADRSYQWFIHGFFA